MRPLGAPHTHRFVTHNNPSAPAWAHHACCGPTDRPYAPTNYTGEMIHRCVSLF